MKAYVINLDTSVERLARSKSRVSLLGLEFVRIPGIDQGSLRESDVDWVSPGVAACWLAHKAALIEFLKSGEESCVIFEDDFLAERDFSMQDLEVLSEKLDFLQLGYLKTGLEISVSIFYANVRSLVLHILSDISFPVNRKVARLGDKFLVKEYRGVSKHVVMSDVRPGAHAYWINRDFATYACEVNSSIFLSTDDLYMAASKMRSLRMGRLHKSRFTQDESETTIKKRFRIEI